MSTVYQQISDEIIKVLPNNWQKVCLFGTLSQSSYEFFFYVKVNNEYVQCFSLENVSNIKRNEVSKVFRRLYDVLKSDKMVLSSNGFTFVMTADGKFHVDYEYNEIDNIIAYTNTWKKKYLF